MINITKLLTEHMDIWTAAESEKKSGRGRANSNAGSVYGVKKLRGLILELAVRGKLVPQDPNDEPASELLKRIQSEKAKLIAEGKLKKEISLPAIANDEKPFELPSGWEWIRLGGLGEWGAGATPLRSVSSYYGGTMPWFKSGELIADFIEKAEETVTELALKECSLRLNQPGDVLIAMYGATIGKASILNVRGTTNQAICACTPNASIFNRYLLLMLKAMKTNFIGQGAGGAQPNISREKIITTLTALPPLNEQHRIVAKVDELMTLCDQLEQQHNNAQESHETLVSQLLATLTQSQNAAEFNANWQRIYAHFDVLFTTEASIDALKQTLLQLAVMGKLVPQNPNDKPASELLKSIQAEKAKLLAEGKIKKDKPLAPITDDEKPFDLPKEWEWVRLGVITNFGITEKLNNITNDTWVLDLEDIEKDTSVILQKNRFSEKQSLSDKNKFRKGDVLYGKLRPYLNKVVIADEDGVCTTEILPIRCYGPLENKYLMYALKAPHFIEYVNARSYGMKMPRLGTDDGRISLFPLAPINEQHLIIAKVDALMTLCDQLKTRIQQAGQQKQLLANSFVEHVSHLI